MSRQMTSQTKKRRARKSKKRSAFKPTKNVSNESTLDFSLDFICKTMYHKYDPVSYGLTPLFSLFQILLVNFYYMHHNIQKYLKFVDMYHKYDISNIIAY